MGGLPVYVFVDWSSVEVVRQILLLPLESAVAMLLSLAVACLSFAHGLEHIAGVQQADNAAFREVPSPLSSLDLIHPTVPNVCRVDPARSQPELLDCQGLHGTPWVGWRRN